MALVLDHVFAFVAEGFPDEPVLEAAGYRVAFGRDHEGQGTANRLLLFAENYLELIWLARRREAEANLLRLDRRADWRETGASPFGIGLSGAIAAEHEDDFVDYRLPAFPLGRLRVLARTLEDPAQPLVFVIERHDGALAAPEKAGFPRSFLEHAAAVRGIARVRVEGHGLGEELARYLPESVELGEVGEGEQGGEPRMVVELDHPQAPVVELPPLVRIGPDARGRGA